jgi:hypothetical protein
MERVAQEFRLVERNAALADKRGEYARSTLRSVWSPPNDTFVTDDIPILLARLSQVPQVRS